MTIYPYKKSRLHHDDGTWSDVVSVKFPADKLRFRDVVLADYQTRMRDAAHLRHVKARLRNQDNPVIVVWACLENDDLASKIFPNIDYTTETGEYILSANSLITYTLRTLLERGWLFWEAEEWYLDIPSHKKIWLDRANKVLNWLKAENRLWLKASNQYTITRSDFVNFQAELNAIPVGRTGFLKRFVDSEGYRIAFNTSYFLLEHDDFFSHHSSLGDPYNMAVHQGQIMRPPLYRRATFWCDNEENWHTNQIGMVDVEIAFHHDPDWKFEFEVNPNDESEIAVYTRHYGVQTQNRVVGYTPSSNGRIEFTVIDRQIVSWQRNGNLAIPQNGFVLSFAADKLSKVHFENIVTHSKVNYHFTSAQYQGMKEAIQCGPLLIQNGESALHKDIFDQEQFWISRMIDDEYVLGLVPSDYPTDIDKTRAGRVGIGIDKQANIIVIAISGVNSGFNLRNTDSSGATLVEITNLLLEAGAIEAINLDGGGSSQLFVEGGLATTPGDRRGLPGIFYERMIPSAGVVSN